MLYANLTDKQKALHGSFVDMGCSGESIEKFFDDLDEFPDDFDATFQELKKSNPGVEFEYDPEEIKPEKLEEPEPEGLDLDKVYPSMKNLENQREVSDSDVTYPAHGKGEELKEKYRNTLSPDYQEKLDELVGARMSDFHSDAAHLPEWKREMLANHLHKELEGENLDALLKYSRTNQSDYSRLTSKVEMRLGPKYKDLCETYPSMVDEKEDYRRALEH